METAVVVARIMTIIYLSFALGLIISKKFYVKELANLIDSSAFMLFGGFMAIVLGSLVLHHHSEWSSDWTISITLIGWIALLKGIALLVFPAKFQSLKDNLLSEKYLSKVILPLCLLLGLFFAYFGFLH